MNPATLQRGTHALFSLLAIRAPIEADMQEQLRIGNAGNQPGPHSKPLGTIEENKS